MKKPFRKAISALCAAAMLLGTLAGGGYVSAEGEQNLLYGGTLYWGNDTKWSGGINAGVLTDGQPLRNQPRNQSNWQRDGAGGVFILKLPKLATINKLIVYCEKSNNQKNNESDYKVEYVTEFTVTGYDTALALNTWTEITDIVAAEKETVNLDGDANPNDIAETLVFDDVEVAALKFTSVKTGAWVSEVEAYYLSGDPYNVSELKVAKATVDRAFDMTSNTYGYSSESWGALVDAYNAVEAAITACDGQAIGDVEDYKTQEALNILVAPLYNAAAKLTGDGTTKTTNLLENGIMIYNPSDMQSYASGHNPRTLTDGKKANNDNNWQPNTAMNSVVYLKLNNAADVNKLVIYCENPAEEYKIEVTTADVTNVADVAGMGELSLSWTNTQATRVGSLTLHGNIAYQLYTFTETEGVTAIKLTCTHPNGRYCKLREVEAYGKETGDEQYAPPFNDQIALERKALSGNTTNNVPRVDHLVLTNVDSEAFNKDDVIVASYTIEREGKTITGTVEVTQAWQSIELQVNHDEKINNETVTITESATLTAANVGASSEHYLVGVLFTEIYPTDKVTVSFMIQSPETTEE